MKSKKKIRYLVKNVNDKPKLIRIKYHNDDIIIQH